MSERRNPYHVLGLKKGATEIQIKEAYKVLARKHHPDRNPHDPGARDRFIEIKEAYEDLIERKTSSPVISQVEETNAEFRRGGGYRRLVFRVGGVAGVLLIAGAAFLFSGEIEFRFRDAMARSGDAKTAEKWLGPIAARTGPRAAEARLDVARRYLTENDTASAARMLSTADDALSLAILGDIHVRAGKRDDARKAYERAIGRAKSGETSARAYAGFVSSRDDAAAARVLADAIARYPKDPWVGWMTAVGDLRATRLESARRALEGNDLPAAKPVLAAALVSEARHLGGDLRRLADRQALVKEAHSLLEDASPDPAASWPFGWLEPPVELLRRRPVDWRPTTSLDRIDVARDLARSAASRALGKDGHDESVEYARRARDADPASEAAMMQLGAAHLARASQADDDGLKARSAFTSARTADARSAGAAAGLALALASLKNDSENEMAAWKSAIAIEPENAEWHFGYARSLARGGPGRIADRIAADRRAIKLAPDFGAPRLDLADALFERDELGEAVKALKAATAVPESASRAWRELGDYYFFAKKFPEAVAAYRKAATDPDATAQSAAWLGAAKALGRLKKIVEAHEAIDRATSLDDNLKLNPDDPDLALALKGYSAKTVSRGEDAAVRLQKLGEAHYARANYSEALAAFSQASVIGGQETRALAWHGMARCYATQGLLHHAVLAMDRALKVSPGLPLSDRDPGVKTLLDVAHYEAPGKGTR